MKLLENFKTQAEAKNSFPAFLERHVAQLNAGFKERNVDRELEFRREGQTVEINYHGDPATGVKIYPAPDAHLHSKPMWRADSLQPIDYGDFKTASLGGGIARTGSELVGFVVDEHLAKCLEKEEKRAMGWYHNPGSRNGPHLQLEHYNGPGSEQPNFLSRAAGWAYEKLVT